jgi:hypothetical protein
MARKYETNSKTMGTGAGMLAYFTSLQADEILPIVTPIMANYGMTSMNDVDPEGWYPMQMSLDMFKAIEAQPNAMTNMVSLGMKMTEHMPVPEQVDGMIEAMHVLNAMYDAGIQNFSESEKYDITQISERHVQLVDNNPYPHDLIYGFIYGIARRFMPEDASLTVKRTYDNPEEPNAGGAVYDVTW